jgi:hypothetical protein
MYSTTFPCEPAIGSKRVEYACTAPIRKNPFAKPSETLISTAIASSNPHAEPAQIVFSLQLPPQTDSNPR